MEIRGAVLVAALLGLVAIGMNGGDVAMAQSFSCEMAHTTDEEAVCRTPWLKRLDGIMAEQYQSVRKYLRRQRSARRKWARQMNARLTEGQRRFVATRAECGPDVACIGKAYEGRIMELVGMWKALME